MAVKIGSARSSYGNTAPGDQNNGKEVSTENWYLHSKGWIVLRAIAGRRGEYHGRACDWNRQCAARSRGVLLPLQ